MIRSTNNSFIDLTGTVFNYFLGSVGQPVRIIISIWHQGEELCSYSNTLGMQAARPAGESERLTVVPNPVSETFKLQYAIFDGLSPEKVVAQVRDMRGVLIHEVSLSPKQKDHQGHLIFESRLIAVENLVPGNYVAIIYVDGKRRTEEIVIKK